MMRFLPAARPARTRASTSRRSATGKFKNQGFQFYKHPPAEGYGLNKLLFESRHSPELRDADHQRLRRRREGIQPARHAAARGARDDQRRQGRSGQRARRPARRSRRASAAGADVAARDLLDEPRAWPAGDGGKHRLKLKTVDVGAMLDEGQFGGYQKLLVFATAMTIILDGFDNQVMGGAIPVLMREWHKPRADFGYVLTAGMVGMMVGGAIGGYLGDKIGRRNALLGSVITFGILTIGVAFANDVDDADCAALPRGSRPRRRDADRHGDFLGIRAAAGNVRSRSRSRSSASRSAARSRAGSAATSCRGTAGACCSASAARCRWCLPRFSSRCFRSRRAIWRACRHGGASCARC